MAEKDDRKNFLLTASPGRLMVSLSLPAIVGMVVIGLYTFVDAIYAGQLIGTDAMGAVSIALASGAPKLALANSLIDAFVVRAGLAWLLSAQIAIAFCCKSLVQCSWQMVGKLPSS